METKYNYFFVSFSCQNHKGFGFGNASMRVESIFPSHKELVKCIEEPGNGANDAVSNVAIISIQKLTKEEYEIWNFGNNC
jgi:hypothetical protein